MKKIIGAIAAAALLAPAAASATPDLFRLRDRDRTKDCTTCDGTPDRDRLRDGSCTTTVAPLPAEDQDRTQDRDRTHLWDGGSPWWSALLARFSQR